MSKTRVFFIGALLAIFLVSLVWLEKSPVQTAGFVNPRERSLLHNPVITEASESSPAVLPTEVVRSQPDTLKTESTVAAESLSTPAQPQNVDEQAEVLSTLQALLAQDTARLRTGPGWLHVELHHRRAKDESSTLPNGQSLPLDYISETWYRLNEKGLVVATVAFMRAVDGTPVQISTFKDNVWRNLTLAETWEGEPYTPRLDLGFGIDIQYAATGKAALRQQALTMAGQSAIQFTLHENFDAPLQMEGYTQPIIAAERRAVFAAQTGALLQAERLFVAEDGQIRVVEHVDVVINAYGIEPSSEVLTLLQQEVSQ